MTEPLLIRYK